VSQYERREPYELEYRMRRHQAEHGEQDGRETQARVDDVSVTTAGPARPSGFAWLG
jgi:hypothetical protein